MTQINIAPFGSSPTLVDWDKPLDNRDSNGVAIEVGMLVAWGDREGVVLIVEGPLPGSESTRLGYATAYVQGLGYWGDNLVVRCRNLEIQNEVIAV
jgi:hypothetical protein